MLSYAEENAGGPNTNGKQKGASAAVKKPRNASSKAKNSSRDAQAKLNLEVTVQEVKDGALKINPAVRCAA